MEISKLIEQIQKEQKRVTKETHDAEGMARLQEVAKNYDGEYKLIWTDDILEKINKRPQKRLHSTKIQLLDELLGGFREQQVITLTGHSAHGKTQFGLFLLEQLEELSPVMIPIEQSAEEIVEQRRDNGYSIPRFLSPENLAGSVTTDWIEQRVIEGIAKYNTKLVLIDHLGYISPGEKYSKDNLAYRIEMTMKQLKNIAKRWNVIIVVLVHISQLDESVPPSTNDLKNSSAIFQESDTVLMIWRKNKKENKIRVYEDKVMLSVHKNRRTGKNGNLGLVFDTQSGRYQEENTWVSKMEDEAKTNNQFDDF